MEVIYCDICKKAISQPIPGRAIFHYADFEVCEPCKDDLEFAMKKPTRAKQPFTMAWNDEYKLKLLSDGAQRGKIPGAR